MAVSLCLRHVKSKIEKFARISEGPAAAAGLPSAYGGGVGSGLWAGKQAARCWQGVARGRPCR